MKRAVAAALGSLMWTSLVCAQQPQTAPQAEQAKPTQSAPATQQTPPVQAQSDDAIAAEAARKAAADAEHQQWLKDMDKGIADNLHALHAMTPAERLAFHKQYFPDFVKKVGELDRTSNEILSAASHGVVDAKAKKEIEKRSKTLEDSADWIVGYMLAGGKAPEDPQVSYASMELTERIWVLKYSVPSIIDRIKKVYAPKQRDLIDAGTEASLINDLKSVILLGRALRK